MGVPALFFAERRSTIKASARLVLGLATFVASAPIVRADADVCSVDLHSAQAARARSAHDSIGHDLYLGYLWNLVPVRFNENWNPLYTVSVGAHDPFTGAWRVRAAFVKPRLPGDGQGWARTPMEYVAYFLNLKLDMDYVPPMAYRSNLDIWEGAAHFTEGAVIISVPHFQTLAKLENGRFPVDHEAIISDHRVLSVLLKNPDGHSGNMGIGDHWTDGSRRPVFIDFGASFLRGARVSMTQYPARGNSDPVTRIRWRTYAALKRLAANDFSPLVLEQLLTQEEVAGLLRRRDQIVAYFDDLIAAHGADAVFFAD